MQKSIIWKTKSIGFAYIYISGNKFHLEMLWFDVGLPIMWHQKASPLALYKYVI